MQRPGRSIRRGCAVVATAFALSTVGLVSGAVTAAHATTEANDEIHVDYGDTPGTTMWVHWHGPDSTLDYGLDADYGTTVTAAAPPVTPVDTAGPFWRVQLTGLTANTIYHYRIGAAGLDHTFETAPTDDFMWDDIGDTGSTYFNPAAEASCNKTWMPTVWQQVVDDNPDVVTHGGDISYANDCGVGSVHQFYNDIAPIATQRPIEFAWGNHEYGDPDPAAPPGTPRDTLANYKSRSYMPNPQSEPNDTAKQTSHPGCAPPPGGSGNGCQGSDWGSFQVGHVLFISYGEPDVNDYPDWQVKAAALMATAQNDPTITFIVTYGHRPAYSSAASQVAPKLQTAINALGDKYSPAARPDGKYVLNVGHHVHGGEAFAPQHGVYQVTDGGGGTEIFNYTQTAAGSLWKTGHLEHLRVNVTASSMTLNFICGPVYAPKPAFQPCAAGSVLFSETIPAPGPPPPPPPGPTQYVTNQSVENGDLTGWLGVYNAKSKVADVQPTGGAYDGTWALRITNSATVAQAAGVQNAKPYWVTNTTAGTTYTGSVYVSGPPGTVINLMLRECTAAGSCGSYGQKSVTLGTGWSQVLTTYTAANSGNQIRYYLYAKTIASGGSFLADEFSETSP
jgi:hypothetical protein